jgi:protocatechuate 3,4-dioxygenase beta subunit
MSSSGLSLLLLVFIVSAMSVSGQKRCPQTPSDQLGPFYVANAPVGRRMGPDDLLQDPASRLEIRGRVLSSFNCSKGLSGVSVEMWYAGEPDADGNYYQDDEYRGQVVTSKNGRYRLVQAFPAVYPTRPILHDHFRLSRNGRELLVTQMYFIGKGEGFVSNTTAPAMQTVNIITRRNGSRVANFNMYLNLRN